MLEKDTPGAAIGPRTLEWHSVLVIDESAVFRQHQWRWNKPAITPAIDRLTVGLNGARHDQNRSVHEIRRPADQRLRQRHRR